MNERIKELAEQSNLLPVTIGPVIETRPMKKKKQDLEKFAELIVRECAELCDRQSRSGWNDDRKAQAKLDRDLIKEHFGVEE